MTQLKKLHEKLRPGDAIYYANTLTRVTAQKILFMSKTIHKDAFEAIDITPAIAERFKFEPNATKTVYSMHFGKGKHVNLFFTNHGTLRRGRIRKVRDTDALKWDFKELQFHELQQITDLLLNESYDE